VTDKKAFLLRLDPALWEELARLAQTELRSVNAQIEYLLRDALSRGAAVERRRDSGHPRRSGER